MKIFIDTIPYENMRYPTVGDYWEDKKGVHFHIAKMGNEDVEFTCLIHELIEWYLVKKKGVSIKEIDEFDKKYKGKEPGCDKKAPYYPCHEFAEVIENAVRHELGITHKEFDKTYKPFY